MYKRRARILFLDPGDGARAWLARYLAEQQGADWIEPAAAALFPEPWSPATAAALVKLGLAPPAGSPVSAWSELAPEAWDLVVALGEGPEWTGHLGGIRHKVWRLEECFPVTGDPAALAACREELRARVEGLLGGFRMKAREDDAPEGGG